jgi:Zn-dependent protease
MSKVLKYGILEDIDTVRRIPIGQVWDVNLLITPITWLSPFVFFGLHILVHFLNSHLNVTDRLYQALLFTIAVEITTVFHAFGHILSGKLVQSPMDDLLITATRDVNLYHGDQRLVPSHVHLVRALGGPIFNLCIAGLCSMFAPMVPHGFWSDLLASLISTNLFFGFGGFLPLPSVDGEVIWRELPRPITSRLRLNE